MSGLKSDRSETDAAPLAGGLELSICDTPLLYAALTAGKAKEFT
jgi:hypothetical protein